VALLSFGASAWKLKARENFVGWSEAQRQHNLQLVLNNARFLILPWIQSKGLASKLAVPTAQKLRQRALLIASWQRVHRMFSAPA
jgi:hypothetical protein